MRKSNVQQQHGSIKLGMWHARTAATEASVSLWLPQQAACGRLLGTCCSTCVTRTTLRAVGCEARRTIRRGCWPGACSTNGTKATDSTSPTNGNIVLRPGLSTKCFTVPTRPTVLTDNGIVDAMPRQECRLVADWRGRASVGWRRDRECTICCAGLLTIFYRR